MDIQPVNDDRGLFVVVTELSLIGDPVRIAYGPYIGRENAESAKSVPGSYVVPLQPASDPLDEHGRRWFFCMTDEGSKLILADSAENAKIIAAIKKDGSARQVVWVKPISKYELAVFTQIILPPADHITYNRLSEAIEGECDRPQSDQA